MSGHEHPDPSIPQDPGVPGFDVVQDPSPSPPVEGDEDVEEHARPDDADDEGHMATPRDG